MCNIKTFNAAFVAVVVQSNCNFGEKRLPFQRVSLAASFSKGVIKTLIPLKKASFRALNAKP
jgi:hypothetical protein